MIDGIARLLRSFTARLIGEKGKVTYYLLKIPYGISIIFHRLKLGSKNRFIVIENFDHNLKLKINPSWDMSFSIYWSGFHEFHEFLFLNNHLNGDMVFVDIGANLGEYSVFAARRVAKVLAFEPLPKMQVLLKESILLNNFTNVQIFPYGLSDKEQMLTIHEIDNSHEGLSTFFPGERITRHVHEVPLKSFDAEFSSFGVSKIDFIKVDIEGGELYALKGARKAIEKYSPDVMIEINGPTYHAAGYSIKDVYEFFQTLGYKPFEINKHGSLVPSELAPVFGNIVFRKQ